MNFTAVVFWTLIKMAVLEILIAVVVFCAVLYKIGRKNFGYWRSIGVKEIGPVPFLGDNYPIVLQQVDGIESVQRLYNAFEGERFGGIYIFRQPVLMIRDLELIKQIMVKDSDCFINKHTWVKEGADPLFSRSLMNLKDQKWRDMRNTLSSVFTAAKIKNMFQFMSKCGIQATDYIEDLIGKQLADNHPDGNVLKMELKGFFTRYTTDVIASTTFGLETDSFKNPDNEFYKIGDKCTKFTKGILFFRFMFILMFPYLAEKFKLSFFGEKYNRFFLNIITETIREREEKKIVRPDLIHLLMEARKEKQANNNDIVRGKLPDLTDVDITAQAMIFFFAGYENISTLLSFATYEIATNPDVQQKLQMEIDRVLEEENGITYEGIAHKMKYLDMVLNETLRKWPAGVMVDREVSKDYTIPKTGNSPQLNLKRGDSIWISIAGLHHDPKYFPNPDKFDPERFSDENKQNIEPYAYIPFGAGPRHCIGLRFALLEVKTCLVHLFKKFTFEPIEKTAMPLKLRKDTGFMLAPVNGFWLGLKLRE